MRDFVIQKMDRERKITKSTKGVKPSVIQLYAYEFIIRYKEADPEGFATKYAWVQVETGKFKPNEKEKVK